MRTRRIAVLAGLAAMLIPATSANADTVQVTTAADATPGCTLRDAVASQEAGNGINDCNFVTDPGTDTITFDPALNGQTIDLTSGLISVTPTAPLEIVGPGMDQLSVSAADDTRVFNLAAGANAISIEGMTIRDGEINELDQARGGCILTGGVEEVTLDEVRVTNCVANASGTTDQFSDGGAIYNGGTLSIDDSLVDGNDVGATNTGADGTAASARGGAIYSDFTRELAIEDSTISGNTATATDDGGGGATAAGGVFAAEAFDLAQSTVTGNTGAPTATGGGQADAAGGVMHQLSGNSTIELSTIAGNFADPSGSGVTFAGGGINSQADMVIRSSTIALNGPTTGSLDGVNLIVRNGTTTMTNSIIADPRGGGLNCLTLGDLNSGGFNVEDSASGDECLESPMGTDLFVDPLLSAAGLANNGGPTQTIALQPTSPVIDQGSNVGDDDTTIDQRGLLRPVDFSGLADAMGGNATDIGAYEVQQACAGQATPTISCTPPDGGGGGGTVTPPSGTPPAGPTGQRAAALQKCKKKKGKKRKKCTAKAKKLPV